MKKTSLIIIFLLLLTYQKVAFAYLDPGTGSAIIQSLIAGGIAALYFFSTSYTKIKSFLFRIFSKKKRHNEE